MMTIPSATYRIQFNKDCRFTDVLLITDYLYELGISTVYASPIFKAIPGSSHGYDITDFSVINPEIGTEAEFRALIADLRSKGISWIQDIVPNHMAYTADNERLNDVLKNGPGSKYAHYFDIDWNHPDPLLTGKLMMPVLGEGAAIEPCQYYVKTPWTMASQLINYRRFFTVNALICLRMEEEEVFNDYHQLVYRWYSEGLIQGIRIDHIDGLKEPAEYIRRLRKLLGDDCYIIAEKILGGQEILPDNWPLQGTSGYEFLSFASQLFTRCASAGQLVSIYREMVPGMPSYQQLADTNKRIILQQYMGGEWDNLLRLLIESDLARGQDTEKLKQALGAILVYLPVYRIYPEKFPLPQAENDRLQIAFERSAQALPELSRELFYLQRLFTDPPADHRIRQSIIFFLQRLMQFAGPVMAKGVEDTTFYVYNPLISHNEVGDSPAELGISIPAFHQRMMHRQQCTPLSLNATTTHDTKRGEDARVRLNVLSEVPGLWRQQVKDWFALNAPLRQMVNGKAAPTPSDEYFIYQSIIGGYPSDLIITDEWKQRLHDYMTKAMHEAKQSTNWDHPNEAYEAACHQFIEKLFHHKHVFSDRLQPFLLMLLDYAAVYSLAHVLIRVTAPGIPDTYQGAELWDLSFVDPDNRRAVDHKKAMEYLQQLLHREQEDPATLFSFLQAHRKEGMEKLFVTRKALQFRKANASLFTEGSYLPVDITGDEVTAIAFARRLTDKWALTVTPFNLSNRTAAYTNEYIIFPPEAPALWTNILTGEKFTTAGQLSLQQLFARFPVALLSSE